MNLVRTIHDDSIYGELSRAYIVLATTYSAIVEVPFLQFAYLLELVYSDLGDKYSKYVVQSIQ